MLRSDALKLNLVMVAILCLVTGVSQFLRNSVGVIAPDLARELAMSPTQIGSLSSIFFFIFALAQVPVGVGIDRYGPRAIILWSAALAVLGCVLFGLGQSATSLIVARLFMGLGCSSFFMAPLVLYARWYPPQRFSVLAGIQQGVGTIGTLVATAPLAYLAAQIGWRASFFSVGVVAVIACVLVFALIRDNPPGAKPPVREPESWMQSFAGLKDVFTTRGFAALMAIHLAGHTAFASVVGLWLGPFLRDVYGLDLVARGNMLLVGALAHVVGLLCWGHGLRLFGTYKNGVVAGALVALVLLGVLMIFPVMPLWVFALWLAAYGFAISFQPLAIAHARSLFPPHLTGRGITMLNAGTMGGVFIVQLVCGVVISQFPAQLVDGAEMRGATAYLAAFAVTGLWLAVGVGFYRFLPVPDPADAH